MKFNYKKYSSYSSLITLLYCLRVIDQRLAMSKVDTIKSTQARFFCDE